MANSLKLFETGNLGLTVYSPDAVRSRLLGHLDHHIHDTTGLVPQKRQWIRHTVASVTAFYGGEVTDKIRQKTILDYESLPVESIQHGHLFVQLMITGRSLLTLWHGENAIEKLLAVKGITHPTESPRNTIRGSFWCDNAICNLIHTSDDLSESERELTAIHQQQILEQEVVQSDLFPKQDNITDFVAHSGIWYLCQLVERLLFNLGQDIKPIQLPSSHDATKTLQHLSAELQKITIQYPDSEISHLVEAYLNGEFVAVSHKMQELPVSRWEQFVIGCGAISRDKWNNS